MKKYKFAVEFYATVLAESEDAARDRVERSIDWDVESMDLIDEDDVSFEEAVADCWNDERKL